MLSEHAAGRCSIEAVFFDYDGVLTTDKTGSLTTCRYLSERTGIAFGPIHRAFQAHNDELNVGRTTHADVWRDICAVIGRPIALGLLTEAFRSTPLNLEMLAVARRLRSAGITVGIITDNKQDRMDCLRPHQRLDSIFAPIVVSAAVGSTKEGPAIFEHALRLADVKPEQSIFVDNTKDNLVAPAALGMNTVYFDERSNDVSGFCSHLQARYGLSAAVAPTSESP